MRLLTAILLCLATPALPQDADEGAALFARHCAVCHGAEATGDGPMAPILLIHPTDLTELAALEDGVFPTERTVRRIDGRDPLVSHGSPMPVYGPYFEGRDVVIRIESGQTMFTSQPVVDLIEWLQSIQK
jgi:hypothetical protein